MFTIVSIGDVITAVLNLSLGKHTYFWAICLTMLCSQLFLVSVILLRSLFWLHLPYLWFLSQPMLKWDHANKQKSDYCTIDLPPFKPLTAIITVIYQAFFHFSNSQTYFLNPFLPGISINSFINWCISISSYFFFIPPSWSSGGFSCHKIGIASCRYGTHPLYWGGASLALEVIICIDVIAIVGYWKSHAMWIICICLCLSGFLLSTY